jgi:hypothetical protein
MFTKKQLKQLSLIQINTQHASTLTFFLTCPFGQLTKKTNCPTQSWRLDTHTMMASFDTNDFMSNF